MTHIYRPPVDEEITRMKKAATEIAHRSAEKLTDNQVIVNSQKERMDEFIDEAVKKGKKSMERLLRDIVSSCFEDNDEEDATQIVIRPLQENSLDLKKFIPNRDAIIRRIQKRGKIITDHEYYIARLYCEDEVEDVPNIYEMIDTYSMNAE